MLGGAPVSAAPYCSGGRVGEATHSADRGRPAGTDQWAVLLERPLSLLTAWKSALFTAPVGRPSIRLSVCLS